MSQRFDMRSISWFEKGTPKESKGFAPSGKTIKNGSWEHVSYDSSSNRFAPITR